jgi:hypothetical protein
MDMASTVKVAPLEVLPPGFCTVTLAVPALAIRLAGIAAVNCVVATTVVDSADPFHSTVDPLTKPVPFTVNVKAGPPTPTTFGFKLLMLGCAIAQKLKDTQIHTRNCRDNVLQ